MVRRFSIFCICIATGASSLFAEPRAALARPAQGIDIATDLCAAATARRERADAIPAHLLRAISLAETGRWDAAEGVNLAWPWTVTAEGEGRYFDTKADAMAEVKTLKARGIGNIDVGCMQINLRYHPNAFADLDKAFDPATNVAYAARYLKDLHASLGSWTRAAGAYHSKDPTRGRAYRSRVMRLWTRVRDAPADTGPRAPDGTLATLGGPVRRPSPAVDGVRTAQLNIRLKAARAAARGIDDAASIRRSQLAAWRQDRLRSHPRNHLALMRRAEARLLRRQALWGLDGQKTSFADKRRAQLLAWRRGLKQPTF